MSYATTIADMAEQIRAEERKCKEQRREMWLEFFLRISANRRPGKTMSNYRNPDEVGNHFEVYGYEGWPDLQDSDPWGGIPEFDEHETKENA